MKNNNLRIFAAVFILLLAGVFAAHGGMMSWWPASDSVNGDATKGKAIAAMQCAACHGADGNSQLQQFPKLAGQRARYLDAQLKAFKAGERQSDVMAPIASKLSAQETADVAEYYSIQAVHPDKVTSSNLTVTGRHIFSAGTSNGVPACAMCHGSGQTGGMHGMMMGGMMNGGAAAIPRLEDQHANYLVDQLNRYASGQRKNSVMARIAGALSESDRKAVAQYLAGTQ